MLRHCVFVKFQPSVGRATRDAIYADLARLDRKVPGMLGLNAGANVNPEGLGQGFDEGFLIDFEGAAARDAYLVHPDHQAIGARIVAAAEGGVNGLFVFDFEIA
jgi:hypothetical protein